MSRYIKVTFPSGHLTIELLQTPVVEKWLSVYEAWNKTNIPYIFNFLNILPLDQSHLKTSEEYVNKINIAIDNANALINGMKFPYYAYDGMPWMQTNRIHRCFTTALISKHCWQHNLTNEQLLKLKSTSKKDFNRFVYEWSTPQFEILDMTVFLDEIHNINFYVHKFEDQQFSLIVEQTNNEYLEKFGKKPEKILDFNRDKKFTFVKKGEDNICYKRDFWKPEYLGCITHEEIISSFPDNYEEYNVTIIKSTAGKDYATCYAQYDDAFEYDIRNIEDISSGITIWPNNEHYKFFTGTQFYNWIKNYELRDEMWLNVPIGKVIANTTDIKSSSGPVLVELL